MKESKNDNREKKAKNFTHCFFFILCFLFRCGFKTDEQSGEKRREELRTRKEAKNK